MRILISTLNGGANHSIDGGVFSVVNIEHCRAKIARLHNSVMQLISTQGDPTTHIGVSDASVVVVSEQEFETVLGYDDTQDIIDDVSDDTDGVVKDITEEEWEQLLTQSHEFSAAIENPYLYVDRDSFFWYFHGELGDEDVTADYPISFL